MLSNDPTRYRIRAITCVPKKLDVVGYCPRGYRGYRRVKWKTRKLLEANKLPIHRGIEFPAMLAIRRDLP